MLDGEGDVGSALRALAETVATFEEQLGSRPGEVQRIRAAADIAGRHVASIDATSAALRGEVSKVLDLVHGSVDVLRGDLAGLLLSLRSNIDALRSELGEAAESLHLNLDVLRKEEAEVAPSLHANVDALRSEVAELRADIAVLRGETEGFRAEANQMLETRLAPGVSRAMTRPLAGEMIGRLTTAETVLSAIAPSWADFAAEYEVVASELSERYHKTSLPLPTEYAVEALTSRLLYLAIRALQPITVLETGVANGHSTFVMLAALERNGSGRLYSTDVREDVGALVDERERSRWAYQQLPPTGTREAFTALVESLPPVELFLHDSDHSYLWQRFEYECVGDHLARGAVVISDDVDASYAFLDFCELGGYLPRLLYDRRKVVGVLSFDRP